MIIAEEEARAYYNTRHARVITGKFGADFVTAEAVENDEKDAYALLERQLDGPEE